MRSALALAAFAVGAIAVPFAENKRALEYDVEYAYVTHVVTVTAYDSEPTPAKAPHYGHKNGNHAPKPTAPAYAPPPPVYEAPAPAPAYSAPSSDSPSAGSPPTDYKSAVVYAHNLHRANHSAPALEWDDELERCAQEVADKCVYKHDVYVSAPFRFIVTFANGS